ncbi:hypothetical protein BDW59DRAFT_156584 [Aspergillus cavernicola]|uniref:Uncharacterized protein n=1 Tax=Aspergillus cavernicola TaxID=176166 RepID=A0ABR4J169_9EURO
MTTLSPIPAYTLGTLCLALGINGLFRPAAEYPRFGLPLKGTSISISTTTVTRAGSEARGIREATYGIALIVLQYQGQEMAITTLAAVISLAGLGDGTVVWNYGGKGLRKQAFNRYSTFVAFLGGLGGGRASRGHFGLGREDWRDGLGNVQARFTSSSLYFSQISGGGPF